ncbi:FtsX-like permease family protein [Marivirga tractuosa]|uniref:ABC transporter permease n=1 Tax=Marivirga tractuosa TaxID=1006 RepID=UPI0035CF3ED5
MIKNYIKIAFRNLLKYKLYSTINLIGLSVGLGISILIFLFVQHENSFDDFHVKKDRIVRGLWESGEEGNVGTSASTPMAFPTTIRAKFDGVEKATHYVNTGALTKIEGGQSIDQQLHVVSADFLDIFSFESLKGENNPFLNEEDASQIVITKKVAERYFGTTDALGKTLLIQLGLAYQPFIVKSVLANPPSNSSLDFEILLPEATLKTIIGEDYQDRWHNTYGGSFVLLAEGSSISDLEAGFASLVREIVERDEEEDVYNLHLQSLEEIHLDSSIETSTVVATNPKLLWILSGIAVLILLIACINFTTLSIGRSATRAKEVGVRKTMGAAYKQLFGQFMTESMLMTFAAAIVGIVLANLFLPVFNNLFEKSLEIIFSPVQLAIILALLILITFIAGAYPALFLSQLRPIAVLKSSLNLNFGKQGLRKFLLGFQLFLSLFLLACTLIMYKQMKEINQFNLGFTKDNILMVEVPAIPDQSIIKIIDQSFKKADRYKKVIQQNAQIESAAIANATYGNETWWEGGFPDKTGEMQYFKFSFVGAEYADILDLEFVAGRNFSADIPSDSGAVIINEAFAQLMKMENPLQEQIHSAKGEGFKNNRIIGVMKDFHHAALYDKIEPVMIALNPQAIFSGINSLNISGGTNPTVYVKAASDDFQAVLSTLKSEWVKLYPEEPFNFSFLDEVVQRQYLADQQLGKMVGIASLVAIFIAAMGLFALASLSITGRMKEIGIRKVMGASAYNISLMFNKEFLKITLIGIVLAMPVSYWLMSKWLDQFEMQSAPGIGVFLITIALGIAFTVIIVSFQTIKAGLLNPVKSLKEE